MAFVFVSLLQHDLEEFIDDWNNHLIRRSSHNTVSGRPNDLYCLPFLHGISKSLVLTLSNINDYFTRYD